MHEEVSRLITLLEEGKISASEAERLIKALNERPPRPAADSAKAETESESGTESTCCPNPFRDLQHLAQRLSDLGARAARRHARFARWRYDEYRRAEAEARDKRAKSVSAEDRVRYILRERVFVDRAEIAAEDSVPDMLQPLRHPMAHHSRIAWHNLQRGVEDEFGISIPEADCAAWKTVQEIVDYVSRSPEAEEA